MRNLVFALLLLPLNAFALVEYDDSTAGSFTPTQVKKGVPSANTTIKRNAPPASSSRGSSEMFSLNMGYQNLDISDDFGQGSIHQYTFDAHFQTGFNIYMDFHHWMGSTSSTDINEKSSTEQGNPRVKIGFNWFKIGSAEDLATIDLIGGVDFGHSSSLFARGSTNQFYGIETTKRYHNFVIGLSYTYTLTGASDNEEEMDVGDMKTILASVGWKATPDIGFAIEAARTTIDESDNIGRNYYLKESISYGYISPKLLLGISPLVHLEMGALFRSQRPDVNEDILRARLYDQKGLYGNSLFTKLILSI